MMCRLLMVRSDQPFSLRAYLPAFAEMCRGSKEYQGHGWGMAWRESGAWRVHKNLEPIWRDGRPDLEAETDFLLVHARSAFRDEGIVLENNMPFFDDRLFFIFNGELRGVRLKAEGRIGAEKIFNFVKRFDRGDPAAALRRAGEIIRKRAEYVRAMNIMMTDGDRIYVSTHYSEDAEYFTLHCQFGEDRVAFCSQPLDGEWLPMPNHATLAA